MQSSSGIMISLACGAVVVLLVFLLRAWRRERRRRHRCADFAKARNLNYAPDDRLDLPTRYRALTLFQRGHNRRSSHVVSGPSPCGAVSCFRYEYETGSGAERAVRTWGVAVVETDLELPPATVLPDDVPGDSGAVWADGIPDQAVLKPGAYNLRIFRPARDSLGEIDVQWCESLASEPVPAGLETRGHLIAAYSPAHEPQDFDRLLTIACQTATQIARSTDAALSGRDSSAARESANDNP